LKTSLLTPNDEHILIIYSVLKFVFFSKKKKLFFLKNDIFNNLHSDSIFGKIMSINDTTNFHSLSMSNIQPFSNSLPTLICISPTQEHQVLVMYCHPQIIIFEYSKNWRYYFEFELDFSFFLYL